VTLSGLEARSSAPKEVAFHVDRNSYNPQPLSDDTPRSAHYWADIVQKITTMSDDFGLDSDDDLDNLLAAQADAVNSKRSFTDGDQAAQPPQKRLKALHTANSTSSSNTALANKILKERFGLDAFRLEQEAAITRILDGGSAVVVFPTGGGKSLCYQVCCSNRMY
jgi:hypothetical protein